MVITIDQPIVLSACEQGYSKAIARNAHGMRMVWCCLAGAVDVLPCVNNVVPLSTSGSGYVWYASSSSKAGMHS